jgi:hypothetical protein
MQMSRWERACKRHDLVGILVDTGRKFKGAFVLPKGRIRSPMPVREARRYRDFRYRQIRRVCIENGIPLATRQR